MLRYSYYQTYTQEIPDEFSLGFSVLGCDIHCPDCHSSHTWDINSEGQGTPLTTDVLDTALASQHWVTCVLFFGGEWDLEYLEFLCRYLMKHYQKKLALYSGRNLNFFLNSTLLDCLTYLKIGHYDKKLGGLIYPSTNQRLYRLSNGIAVEDLTSKFWKTRIT